MPPPTTDWRVLRRKTLEQLWNPAEIERHRHPDDRVPMPQITGWHWSRDQLQITFTGPWRIHTLWTRDWENGPYQMTRLVTDYQCSMTVYFQDDRPVWSALRCEPIAAETDERQMATRHLAYILEQSGLQTLADWINPPPTPPSNGQKMAEQK